jgi:hypothetical protein
MQTQLAVAKIDEWKQFTADHCEMMLPVFAEEFIQVLCKDYKMYIELGYLERAGEFIPSALDIFVCVVEMYNNNASLVDLMLSCIQERFGLENDLPSGERVYSEQDVAMNILQDTWDKTQEVMVHDMQLFLERMQMAILRPGTKQIINSAAKEVW